MKVIMYLDSTDTSLSFFLINKKCGMLSTMLKMNPLYQVKSVEKELQLFPMIETFRCNSSFFSYNHELPSTIKYLHIIDKTKDEATNEKDIDKELLECITYYETRLTKLSLLKQMNQLETLKVFCLNDKRKNKELFTAIESNKHLKRVIIDARRCEPKNIVNFLLDFNTSGREIVLICRNLEQIISKDNVVTACSYGSTEVTKLTCKDYIPFQTNDYIERSKEFTFQYGKEVIWYSKSYIPTYYRFILDSLIDMKHFKFILNHTLPTDVCIDITKKKGSKLNSPSLIDLTNENGNDFIKFLSLLGSVRGKKLLDITLPSSLQTLMVNSSSFNFLNTNSVENLFYDTSKTIQTSFPNLTKLTLRNCTLKNSLDLSSLNNLLYCDVESNSSDIIFPKHQLNEVYVRYKDNEYYKNKKDGDNTIPLSIKNLQTKSLDLGATLYYKSITLADLSTSTSITTLKLNENTNPTNLPTSIIFATITHHCSKSYEHICDSIAFLTNLQSLKISSFVVNNYTTLTNLTSLEVIEQLLLNPAIVSYRENYSQQSVIDMSKFNKLVDIKLNRALILPILPTSVTCFHVSIIDPYKFIPPHYSDYANLTNLQDLVIRNSPQITSFPTSLKNLEISTKSQQPLDLSQISLTKFNYAYEEREKKNYEPHFILPPTLKDISWKIRTTNYFTLPDFKQTPNLVECSIGYCKTIPKKYSGPWYLPNSLEIFSCFNNITYPPEGRELIFENIENTKLPKDDKKSLLKSAKDFQK